MMVFLKMTLVVLVLMLALVIVDGPPPPMLAMPEIVIETPGTHLPNTQ